VAVLGPVKLQLVALNLLKLELSVFDKNGKLLKVKEVVNVNLELLGKVIKGVECGREGPRPRGVLGKLPGPARRGAGGAVDAERGVRTVVHDSA
jgi:hypothetical protein